MTQPTVFISYSHKDEAWKNRLATHLGVLQRQGLLDPWDDRRIGAGQDWRQEIQEAIDRASVAVLLVSADFLTSDFILGQEVPRLLQRRDGEGLRVFPVIVRPCAWKRVEWLARMQVRPRDGSPLSAGDEHQIDADLAAVAEEIANIVSPAPEASESPIASELRRFLDEDFPRLEESLHDVWISLGHSPLDKYSATSNWQTIASHFIDIPEEIRAIFEEVVQARQLAWGGTSKLTQEQLSSATQGINQILGFLHQRFPAAGVELPSPRAQVAAPGAVRGRTLNRDRADFAIITALEKRDAFHALLIGVGDYDHARFSDLPATVRDAQALADVLTDPRRGAYPPGNVRTIAGSDATAATVRAALERLAGSTNRESTAFVYFSGHGGRALENGHWRTYLCPREADPDDLSNTAISGDEFSAALAAIPARRVLVMLDACHAGGSAELKAADGTTIWKSGLPEAYYEALSRGSGRVVIASSKARQYSRVRPQGDLSLFTYHLRDALTGKAAVRGDGLVHVLDVFHYVNEAVRVDEPDQTPILKVNDLDLNFPIAVAPTGISGAPKASGVAREVEGIREQIVRDPIAGAEALSEYLKSHPDLAAKRDEVDLKRSQLEGIQHDLELFGPDPGKKAEKSRAVFYLLRICLELERSE